jgi:hypothetical protein
MQLVAILQMSRAGLPEAIGLKTRLRPSVSTTALRSPERKFETRTTSEIGYTLDFT